jgi:hypothetical protein
MRQLPIRFESFGSVALKPLNRARAGKDMPILNQRFAFMGNPARALELWLSRWNGDCPLVAFGASGQ